jgi:hypothetical protein
MVCEYYLVCVFEGEEVGGAEEALLAIQLTPHITAYPEELGSIILSYFIHFYVLKEKTFFLLKAYKKCAIWGILET